MPRKAKPKKPKEFYFKGWMIGQLRRICRRYPPYYQTLNSVKEEYYITTKAGKQLKRVKYTCSKCKGQYSSKEVQVDHIIPIVPIEGFPMLPNGEPDWNSFIPRLFCGPEGLQVLCTGCHDEKTQNENSKRKEYRNS